MQAQVGRSNTAGLLAVCSVVAGTLLLSLLHLLHLRHQLTQGHHTNWRKRDLVPGVGPNTTLVVTDIEVGVYVWSQTLR